MAGRLYLLEMLNAIRIGVYAPFNVLLLRFLCS